MKRFVALVAVVLSACASHQMHLENSTARAPHGVVVPANAAAGTNYRGVFVGSSGDSDVWLAPDAILRLRKDRAADYVALVFWVPNSTDHEREWFDHHRLTVSSFLDGSLQQRCCFDGGVHSVHFALPADMRSVRGDVDIPIHIGGAFVLHDIEPTSSERRRLGAILMRVFFYSLRASP